MIKSLSIVALLLAALATAIIVARGGSPAKASESPVPNGQAATGTSGSAERFTSYRAPTGPEMSPLAAAAVALQALKTEEVEHGTAVLPEVNMAVGHGVLAEMKALLEGKSASDAETSPTVGCLGAKNEAAQCATPIETVERRRSGAYLVVMTGRTFAPNVPLPRGRKGPSGNVRAIVLNSTTGFIEEEYVGSWMPLTGSLKAVDNFSSAIVSDAASSGQAGRTERLNPHLGYLAGRVFLGHTPEAGWRVRIGRHSAAHPTLVRRTFADGRFIFHSYAGNYVVAAQRPDGRLCGATKKRIVAKGLVKVVIVCH